MEREALRQRSLSDSVTLILDLSEVGDDTFSNLLELAKISNEASVEILVTSLVAWKSVPAGITVLELPGMGRLERWDSAAEVATGSILIFSDSMIADNLESVRSIVNQFDDTDVVAALGRVDDGSGVRSSGFALRALPRWIHERAFRSRLGLNQMRVGFGPNDRCLAVRSDMFKRSAGFQSAATNRAAILRLVSKIRDFGDGKVVIVDELSEKSVMRDGLSGIIGQVSNSAREMGYFARRLPEMVRTAPQILGLIGIASVLVALVVAIAVGSTVEVTLAGSLLAAWLLVFMARGVVQAKSPIGLLEGIFQSLAQPFMATWYLVNFILGYLGPDLGEISPPRETARPLRVLILNWRDVTHPWSGGAENYMHQVALGWVDRGIDVSWLTQRHKGSAKEDVIDRIHIYRAGGRFTLYARAAIKYVTSMRGQYDVIVDCENGIPFFSPLYSKVPTVLVIHHVHQEIFRKNLPVPFVWLALALEGKLMPLVYKKSSVVAVSNGSKDDLMELGFLEDQIRVITNGVKPTIPSATKRSEIPTIFCMGRLKKQKSVDVLLRAVPALVAELGEVRVDIVGQGPDRRRLELLCSTLGIVQYVRFHGYVSSRQRDSLAASAWLAVCPSSFEGWGVVCMEASARGLAVVASDVAGLRESVRDGETGLLFPYGDHDALSSAVLELVRDETKRASMEVLGKRWASLHTWSASSISFEGVLRSVVASGGISEKGRILDIRPTDNRNGRDQIAV